MSSRLISQEVFDLWRVTTSSPVNLEILHPENSLSPFNTESQVKLLVLTLFAQSLYSMLEMLQSPGYVASFLPVLIHNFQNLEKSTGSHDSHAQEA